MSEISKFDGSNFKASKMARPVEWDMDPRTLAGEWNNMEMAHIDPSTTFQEPEMDVTQDKSASEGSKPVTIPTFVHQFGMTALEAREQQFRKEIESQGNIIRGTIQK